MLSSQYCPGISLSTQDDLRWHEYLIIASQNCLLEITRFTPGSKHGCSKLAEHHRLNTARRNAIRSKLSVKGRSSMEMLNTNNGVIFAMQTNPTERTMCADFAARGRPGRQGRELNWSAPV